MTKTKKLFSLFLTATILMTTVAGLNVNANTTELVNQNGVTTDVVQQKDDSLTQKEMPNQYQLDGKHPKTIKVDQSQVITKTGEAVSLNQEKAKVMTSKLSASKDNIGEDCGIIKGTLTSTNSMQYLLFSRSNNFLSISKIVTNNENYTMTLGIVNYQEGNIDLTNIIVPANQQYASMLDSKYDYAWVIQSKNGSYGDNFTLQYNISLPNADNIIYIAEDYQKIYTLNSNYLYLNNQNPNLDYKYNIEWKTNLSTGLAWHTEHIWLENPNVNRVVHVGGFQLKHGNQYVTYPHSVVFEVGVGGTFTHYLDQNPPRVYHNSYDVVGKYTPRPIDSDDIEYFGSHYLVYDLDSAIVKEFVSGLSREWSKSGDKSQPKLID